MKPPSCAGRWCPPWPLVPAGPHSKLEGGGGPARPEVVLKNARWTGCARPSPGWRRANRSSGRRRRIAIDDTLLQDLIAAQLPSRWTWTAST